MKSDSGVNLSVDLAGLKLRTPIITASGTYGWGTEFEEIEGFRNDSIGAIILKGTTLEACQGNRTPRIVETAGGAGIINSIGLQNPGAAYVVKHYLPKLADHPAKVIANVSGSTIEEYATVTKIMAAHDRTDAVEVNVSCPNVKKGGMAFGADAGMCSSVVTACRAETDKSLIVKLTPNVTDIRPMAAAAIDAGADILTVANTVLATAIDIRTRKPILGNVSGGLSGPAIKPIALQKVLEVARFLRENGVSTPIIASGGIMTAEDALEFVIAGASAFAIGTALFADFNSAMKIARDLEMLLGELGATDINDLVGTVELP